MADQNQIDKIIETFTSIFEQAKTELAPFLKKDAWDSWAEVKANADTIMSLITEIGKMLVVAKETVVGVDGVFSSEDADTLLHSIGAKINEIVDIPFVPEGIEGYLIDFALHSAYKSAAKKIKILPVDFASYKKYASNVKI